MEKGCKRKKVVRQSLQITSYNVLPGVTIFINSVAFMLCLMTLCASGWLVPACDYLLLDVDTSVLQAWSFYF